MTCRRILRAAIAGAALVSCAVLAAAERRPAAREAGAAEAVTQGEQEADRRHRRDRSS